MLARKTELEYYSAFVDKNPQYDGVFYAGIKTTGIFCRPTCSARKPKFDNCEFFQTAQDSMLAGYRPCKRCHPLSSPAQLPDAVNALIDKVEAEPEKRWSDADVRALGHDPSTIRRQFKKHFGMTFVAYARARRMGIALGTIRAGDTVINAQLDAAYESGSGFRDAFSKIFGYAPARAKNRLPLKAQWMDTPLGAMLAISDDHHLYLLEFTDRRGLEREIEKMRTSLNAAIIPGGTATGNMLQGELNEYFSGTLKSFKTPLKLQGSEFQQRVLQELLTIPYGQTRSYADQAKRIGRPEAVRAVARANGMNQVAIIIPCHRVIGSNGKLTGYSGGLARKRWLLNHEQDT